MLIRLTASDILKFLIQVGVKGKDIENQLSSWTSWGRSESHLHVFLRFLQRETSFSTVCLLPLMVLPILLTTYGSDFSEFLTELFSIKRLFIHF